MHSLGDDLRVQVLNALHWDLAVPRDRLSVDVENGWVKVSGTVDLPYQRTCAESDARSVPGVIDVVKISSGAAVVATNTWAAMTGRDKLNATWKNGPAAHASSPALFAEAERLARGPKGIVAAKHGDVDAASGQTIEAVYRGPFLAHAAMEPMNATADVRDDGCTVWVPTQVPGACGRGDGVRSAGSEKRSGWTPSGVPR